MDQKVLKLEISVKTIKFAGETGEESFLAYKVFTKKGWVDLKFTKDVKNAPTKNCFIFVDTDKLNINKTGRFPIVWVKEIAKIEEINFTQKVEDYFEN